MELIPCRMERIHLGRDRLIKTSKAAVANKIVESITSRSTVTINYFNITRR